MPAGMLYAIKAIKNITRMSSSPSSVALELNCQPSDHPDPWRRCGVHIAATHRRLARRAFFLDNVLLRHLYVSETQL